MSFQKKIIGPVLFLSFLVTVSCGRAPSDSPPAGPSQDSQSQPVAADPALEKQNASLIRAMDALQAEIDLFQKNVKELSPAAWFALGRISVQYYAQLASVAPAGRFAEDFKGRTKEMRQALDPLLYQYFDSRNFLMLQGLGLPEIQARLVQVSDYLAQQKVLARQVPLSDSRLRSPSAGSTRAAWDAFQIRVQGLKSVALIFDDSKGLRDFDRSNLRADRRVCLELGFTKTVGESLFAEMAASPGVSRKLKTAGSTTWKSFEKLNALCLTEKWNDLAFQKRLETARQNLDYLIVSYFKTRPRS